MDESNAALKPYIVSSISVNIADGAYSVLTPSGNAIVDGILTSNYADIINNDGSFLSEVFVKMHRIPSFHHKVLAPVRWGYRLFGAKAMSALCSGAPHGAPSVEFGKAIQRAVMMLQGSKNAFTFGFN
jgi:hypothetical protein